MLYSKEEIVDLMNSINEFFTDIVYKDKLNSIKKKYNEEWNYMRFLIENPPFKLSKMKSYLKTLKLKDNSIEKNFFEENQEKNIILESNIQEINLLTDNYSSKKNDSQSYETPKYDNYQKINNKFGESNEKMKGIIEEIKLKRFKTDDVSIASSPINLRKWSREVNSAKNKIKNYNIENNNDAINIMKHNNFDIEACLNKKMLVKKFNFYSPDNLINKLMVVFNNKKS